MRPASAPAGVPASAPTTRPEGVPPGARDGAPPVAIFDLDGTITRSDTFLAFLVGSLVRSPGRWHVTPALAWAVAMHLAGRRDNGWLKAFFLRRIVGGRAPAAVDGWVRTFVQRVLAREVLPQARAEIARLKAAGCRLVMASASPDLYAAALAAELGFDDLVCTRVARLPDGRWAGELDGGNCYGLEKRRRIEHHLARLGVEPGSVAFYSDHHSDLPLFEAVGLRYAVNPTPRMADHARRLGIETLVWRAERA